MQLFCLSISHRHTPIELRDCLSLSLETIRSTLTQHPIRQGPYESLREITMLSTCNRFEVYGVVNYAKPSDEEQGSNHSPIIHDEEPSYSFENNIKTGKKTQEDITGLVTGYLQEAIQVPALPLKNTFHTYTDLQAVYHIFQVAAGLDSIAIGETQILGQVSRALEIGLSAGATHHVLSSLFRAAIHAGKRVRSETGIGRHPTNISAIGIQMAEKKTGSLENKEILVVGAGKMARLAVEALIEHHCQNIYLTNRTDSTAAEIAAHSSIQTVPFDNLTTSLAAADLVFTFTSAPQPIIHQEMLAKAMAKRHAKPITLVDLAMPRNVSEDVKSLPGVNVLDMDSLRDFASSMDDQAFADIQQAETIVNNEVVEYEKLLHIIPFIGELHKKIELIRQHEVERALHYLHNPPQDVAEQFELFSKSLVRKILHEPTIHLRTETNEETLNDYVDALGQLFNLTESNGSSDE